MKNKLISLSLAAVSCLFGTSFTNQINLDDVYKATDYIWIKNLNVYNATDVDVEKYNKVISFDINFHSTSLSYKIYAETRATDNDYVLRPMVEPDWRQGMQYQHIDIKLNYNFIKAIGENDRLRVTYGPTELFSFICPEDLTPLNSNIYMSYEEMPDDLVYINEVKLPCIKNGKIVSSFTERIDLSYFNFDAMRTYYYGKFPDQYFWVKFDTNQFNGKITGKKLVKDYKGYGMQMCVFFYEKDLFIDYHEFGSETLNFPYQLFDYFEPLEEIDGYYHLGYTNFLNKVTFSDGTMRIKSELSEYILQNKENKNSKFLTFPLDLDDFEKNFERAKNMKIGIEFYAGAMQNFRLTLWMNLDLTKDFFYNHMNESILIGTHNNEVLDTVDNFYA